MNLPRGRVRLVAGAVLAAAGAMALRVGTPDRSLGGDWETVIASPKRPWIFVVRLQANGTAWTGSMSVRGLPDLPLRDVRIDLPRIHFIFPPEFDSWVFDGKFADGEIAGHVVEEGKENPTRMTRAVPLPAPANRLEAWRQDLDYAGRRLAEYDRSFTPGGREAFRNEVARIERDLPRRNDAEILVALSHAVALSGNAHTRMRLDPTREGTFSTTFPIRLWWFRDGAYVVRAAPAYARTLRCRAVAIEGRPIPEVKARVKGLFGGNAAWGDYMGPLYLTIPDVLYGLGLIRGARQTSFTFEEPGGTRFTIPIRAEPLNPGAMPHESWQELSPLVSTGNPPWAAALAADAAALPIYLRHPDQPYWFEVLSPSGILYLQFNRSSNAEKGPSLAEFGRSFLEFARQHPARAVVVDLRLNAGGNLDVARDFIRSLGNEETINRRGRLFVVVGRTTFSAGLYHAAQLKQFTEATFVGEPVGDRLDFWAEGGDIVLPNSRVVIRYSNGFHRYSGMDYPEHRPYYEELNIRTLDPDVAAPMSSTDYFSGRDPDGGHPVPPPALRRRA